MHHFNQYGKRKAGRFKQSLAICCLLSAISIVACKKSDDLISSSSLNVVNASPGVTNTKVRTPNATGYFRILKGVNYGANAVFNIPTGSVAISFTKSIDTTKSFYSETVNANAGEIYSYFIGGAAGEDIVVNKDIIPVRTDSSLGLRFVNMSYNSSPVNVTLSISTTANEFNNISYKTLSDFKSYSTKSTDPSTYTFQVRDGGGNLLASIAISRATYIQKNITLVMKGMIGGSGAAAPGLFVVTNF